MQFAIIETGGKQYKISPGQKIKIEKLNIPEDKDFKKQDQPSLGQVLFDKVLLVANDKDIKIGNPYIKGAKVEAKILKHGRDRKKIVFRYHSKTRYRKKKGHRQQYTEIQILDIKY